MTTKDDLLEFIKQYIDEHGYSPSYRDMVSAGIVSSTSVANYNLSILEREGSISRAPGKARTIVVRKNT